MTDLYVFLTMIEAQGYVKGDIYKPKEGKEYYERVFGDECHIMFQTGEHQGFAIVFDKIMGNFVRHD